MVEYNEGTKIRDIVRMPETGTQIIDRPDRTNVELFCEGFEAALADLYLSSSPIPFQDYHFIYL